jgi:hypothetical protein
MINQADTNMIPVWGTREHLMLLRAPNFYYPGCRRGMTQEVLDNLRKETTERFYELPEQPEELLSAIEVLRERKREVGCGEEPCPICHQGKAEGNEIKSYEMYKVCRGEITGVLVRLPFPCCCNMLRMFWKNWLKIPERYRSVEPLDRLRPIDSKEMLMSLESQRRVIAVLRDHPEASFFLWGDAGCGKTHLSYAIQRSALIQWARKTWGTLGAIYPPVLRSRAATMLDEHLAWIMRNRNDENHGVPVPSITVARIRAIAAQGIQPLLILDEIDKLGNLSDHKCKVIHEIVDTIYEHKGRIIGLSNASPASLTEKWGEEFALPLLRRCGAIGGESWQSIRFKRAKNF